MLTIFASAFGILKRVPREVWLILAALAALWAWGNHREAQGRMEERAKCEAKARAIYQKQVEELAAASLRYEQLAQSLRTAERADRETIREVFRNVPIPANCAAPAAVGSLLDNAVKRANAAASGEPGSEVPPAP